MIPEHRRDIRNSSNVFYAIGKYNALCFSLFGIEDLMTPPEKLGIFSPQMMQILNIDVSAWSCEKTGEFLKEAYGLLGEALPAIRKGFENGKVQAFIRANEHEIGTVLHFNGFDLRVDYFDKGNDTPKAAGIIIEEENGDLLVMGVNFRYFIINPKNNHSNYVVTEYSEGRFEKGIYIRERMLNGDERYNMMETSLPKAQKLSVFAY